MANYLERLTARLLIGCAALPQETIDRHAAFYRNSQQADGGFSGREGPSDPYYTAFAVRALAILGQLPAFADGIADFLRSRLRRRESVVDFYSLVYAARALEAVCDVDVFSQARAGWPEQIVQLTNKLRRPDGGYAKAEEGHASSTYHSFLVLLCLQLIERQPIDPVSLKEFFHSQKMLDGGFREIRVSRRAGTNPTAAAIGGLSILDAIDDEVRHATIDFLLDMQNDEGGFLANTRIPIADLLSTFTSLWTLEELDGHQDVDRKAAKRFVRSLEQEDGGFLGAAWDEKCDVEYSFYGLGALALLTPSEPE